MAFAQLNLHPNIHKAIAACGYTNPTPIQAQSIPSILQGNDLIASAQTGTGKTAAFVLPALHRLSEKPSKKTRVLILTPTRELASQITKAAATYGKFLRFNIVSLVGGMSYHHQIKDLARGADIIVATPGRLLDHLDQKRVGLSQIEMLVLDEADRMLDMGFIDDVQHIAKLTPADRQTLLFSATVDNKLSSVVKHLLKKPVRIDLSDKVISAPSIKQALYKANNPQHKMRLLKHLLQDEQIYKAIIFTATKIHADKLATQLRDQGLAAGALHGDLKQNVRNRTLDQLRRGKIQFLVATDVAARGIDVSDITHVINYDLPKFCEDYVHRIGRTGRAGKEGQAISFVLPTDMRHVQRIERYIGQRLKLVQDVTLKDTAPANEILSLNKNHFADEQEGTGRRERFSSRREEGAGKRERFAKRDDAFGKRDRFAKHDDANGKRERFAKRDDAFGKQDRFAKRDDASGKQDRFAKRDDAFGKRDRFAKRDDAFGKQDRFAKRDEGYGKQDRFAKRDDAFGKRDKFAKRDDAFGKQDRFAKQDDAPGKRDRFARDRDESASSKRDTFRGKRQANKSSTYSNDDNRSSDRSKSSGFGDKKFGSGKNTRWNKKPGGKSERGSQSKESHFFNMRQEKKERQ